MGTTLWAASVDVLAEVDKNRPKGTEFGRASPVMLLLVVLTFVAILLLVWDMNRRIRSMKVIAARRASAGEDFARLAPARPESPVAAPPASETPDADVDPTSADGTARPVIPGTGTDGTTADDSR